MASTQHPADDQRDSAIQVLLESDVRSSVKDRARRLSAACERLTKQSRPLTIPNVVRMVRAMYLDDNIAESTIWNRTPSGKIYRGVVSAWSVWLLAKGCDRPALTNKPVHTDIPDSLLCRIEPPEVRLSVLLMREALRNTKNQLNALRSLTPERLIRQGGTGAPSASVPPSTSPFSKADTATIKSFINDHDLRLRGFYWDENGALVAGKTHARTAPGVLDALRLALKFLEAAKEPE